MSRCVDRDWGYTYRPRTSGGAVRRFRVPTLLERQGDFSQSTDLNGAPVTIRDYTTGQPFPGNRIPQDRLYPIGLNILKLWPEPNAQGLNYNYENTAPEDTRLTQQPTVRVDYQASSRLRLTARYTGQLATVKPTAGTIPGFNDWLLPYPFIHNPAATVNYTVSPTLFLEGTYGFIQNQLGVPNINQASNRCNVGLCELPVLFPEAGVVDARYYSPTVLEDINSPMFVDGRILLPPLFSWGSRIASPPPNLGPLSNGCSDNQYAQFNTAAFAGPLTGSNGLESGRNYMVGCFENVLDLAVARTIRIRGSKDLQFRLDVFNALNSVIYTGRVTQLQLSSPTDQTVRNAQYNADGTLNQARLRPRNAGFGAATGAAALRSLQLQLRFRF